MINQGEEILKQLGKRLRELRLARNLTQEELAAHAGFSRSYYTEIETGKRNVSIINLYRLSLCLEVDLKEFFNFNSGDN